MTQQAVERALGKLLTDEAFRERFSADPESASWEAGFVLSPTEVEALLRLRARRSPSSLTTSTSGSVGLDPEAGKVKRP